MSGGDCAICKGAGHYWADDKYEKLSDEWEQIEPPAGEGYQIWETVSEGSPVSPVFADPEELASWMVENDDSVTKGTTKENWLKWIMGPGWSPSLIVRNGVVSHGIGDQ